MSQDFQPFYIFEHPNFKDVHDAQRQSRLYGFRYRAAHEKFEALSQKLTKSLPAELLERTLAKPLEEVPDNSALYILNITPEGRQTFLPVMLAEALALGFSVLDDSAGQCHCPEGLWTLGGLQPQA
jgi:hypothetical protein